MDACPRYLCTCVYVIVCMSARKKAPLDVPLRINCTCSLVCPCSFELSSNVLIPYCWLVALEKKKKKKKGRHAYIPIKMASGVQDITCVFVEVAGSYAKNFNLTVSWDGV